jgi:hypothetical protein
MAAKQYNSLTSFSGADLVVTFGSRTIGELQQISWAVQREKAPIFTLGDPDPRSFSRGKRGIAGSLVFAVFDRDSLIEELRVVWQNIAPVAMFSAKGNIANQATTDFANALTLSQWASQSSNASQVGSGTAGAVAGSNGQFPIGPDGEVAWTGYSPTDPAFSYVDSTNMVNVPQGFGVLKGYNMIYADMLPPFDITMTFANEYGQAAFQKIYDIDILNESSGVSVDSVVMERQLTYIARRISPIIAGVYVRDFDGTPVFAG